ncbi:MAG: hypothetical protein LBU65_08285 [Planctomycetaceae bacterium]|nr:hypothetical protein [Planctomycetaceae bacterium]
MRQNHVAASLVCAIGISGVFANAGSPNVQYEMVPHVVIPQTIEYKPTPKTTGSSNASYGVTSPSVATYVPFPSYTLPYPTAFYPVNDVLYPVTQGTKQDTDLERVTQQQAIQRQQQEQFQQLQQIQQLEQLQQQQALPQYNGYAPSVFETTTNSANSAKKKPIKGREISLVSANEESSVVSAVDNDSEDAEIMPAGMFGGDSSSAWSFSSPIFKIASIPAQSLQAGGAINQNGPRCQTALTVPTNPYPPTPEYNVMMPQFYQLPNGMVVPMPSQREGFLKRLCHPAQPQYQIPQGMIPQMQNAAQAMMPYQYTMPQQCMMPQAYPMPYQQAYYGVPAVPPMMAYQQYQMPYGMQYMPQAAQQLPATSVSMNPQQTPITAASLPTMPVSTSMMPLGLNGQTPMMLVQMTERAPSPLPNTTAIVMTPQGPQLAMLAQVNPLVGQQYSPVQQQLGKSDETTDGDAGEQTVSTTTNQLPQSLNQPINSNSLTPLLAFNQQYAIQQPKILTQQVLTDTQGQTYYMIVPCDASGSPMVNPMQQLQQQPQFAQNNGGITMTELALLLTALKDDHRRSGGLRERIAARRDRLREERSSDPLAKLLETWKTPSYPTDTAMRMPAKNAYPYGYFGASVAPIQSAAFGGYYDSYMGVTSYPGY